MKIRIVRNHKYPDWYAVETKKWFTWRYVDSCLTRDDAEKLAKWLAMGYVVSEFERKE